MHEIDVEAEARQVLAERGDEERAQLIERSAKAIFKARVFGLRPLPESMDLNNLWSAELATSRILYRNQARAVLAASELLERVDELERRIAAASSELEYTGLTAKGMASAIGRARRVLAKPLPPEEPIGIKR